MAIPIFFVHKTNSSYLKYALKQARKFNPDSPIYLLGDDENNKYRFVTHINISDYSSSAEEFKTIYKHMSAVPYEINLIWFQRWFYINEFVRGKGIEYFIYLDSDVLVYSNLTEAIKPYKNILIANTGRCMPATTYFSNSKALSDFCDFMISQYKESRYIARMTRDWEDGHKPRNYGGIDDQVMFEYYSMEFPEKFGKLDIIANDSVFDSHIRISDGFEMIEEGEDKNKRRKWNNNILQGFHIQNKKWIRFHNIHFHGHAKKIMYRNYKGGGYYLPRIKEYIQELRDKYQLRTKFREMINYYS
ncbi:MAG: hypothetical protein AB7G44_15335 [Bacteroidia bacterium]